MPIKRLATRIKIKKRGNRGRRIRTEMVPGRLDHTVRAVLDKVVQQQHRLVDPPPVLALLILEHPLPEHAHHLQTRGWAEGSV